MQTHLDVAGIAEVAGAIYEIDHCIIVGARTLGGWAHTVLGISYTEPPKAIRVMIRTRMGIVIVETTR